MFLSSMFTTLIVIPSVFSEEVTSVKVFFLILVQEVCITLDIDECIVIKMDDLHQLARVRIVEILRKRCMYCHKDG